MYLDVNAYLPIRVAVYPLCAAYGAQWFFLDDNYAKPSIRAKDTACVWYVSFLSSLLMLPRFMYGLSYAQEKIASRAIDPLKVNIMCAESEDCPYALLLMGCRQCRNNANEVWFQNGLFIFYTKIPKKEIMIKHIHSYLYFTNCKRAFHFVRHQ